MLSYVPKSGLNARGTKAHVDRASKWRWKRAWHPKSDSRREPDPQNSNDVARSPECRFWGCPKAEHNMWNWHILKLLWEQAKVGSNVLGVRTTRKGSNVKPCPPTLSVASPEVIPIALEIISIASPLGRASLLQPGHRGPKRLLTKHCSHAKFLGDTKAEMQIRTEPQQKITEIHWFTCSLGQEAFYWWTIPTN